MEQEENLNQFKNFIEVIYAHIDNKDIKKLETLLPLIESYENIFLKLYHKRKKEGVYYTSEQISSFISNEVLILLINNKLNIDGHNLAKIQNLNEIFKLDAEMRRKIGNSLYYVTICDPACGSGGFLLSAVDIIFKLVIKLNPKRNKFEIKKQLLKNLYGYDINSDAINLSVLKLFRWIFDDNSENIPQIVSQLKTNFKSLNTLTQTNLNKFDIIIGNPPYGNIVIF
ncbi:MAG: N-6 DNA methylase [Promethearchaeota archaeon]|jgi:type I restriction-modification system DNA methylase subunit